MESALAFLSVAQGTVVARWERPECDGEMNYRLPNCRRYGLRKQIRKSEISTIRVNACYGDINSGVRGDLLKRCDHAARTGTWCLDVAYNVRP